MACYFPNNYQINPYACLPQAPTICSKTVGALTVTGNMAVTGATVASSLIYHDDNQATLSATVDTTAFSTVVTSDMLGHQIAVLTVGFSGAGDPNTGDLIGRVSVSGTCIKSTSRVLVSVQDLLNINVGTVADTQVRASVGDIVDSSMIINLFLSAAPAGLISLAGTTVVLSILVV